MMIRCLSVLFTSNKKKEEEKKPSRHKGLERDGGENN